MPAEKESGSSSGFGKLALENTGVPLVYAFLEELGITTGIKRIAEVSVNGHHSSVTWIGTGDIGTLDKGSVLLAGGSGCLELAEGSRLTTIFIKAGQVVNEITEPKEISPNQARMNI